MFIDDLLFLDVLCDELFIEDVVLECISVGI